MDPIAIGATVGALTVAVLASIISGEPPSVSADGKRAVAAYGRVVKAVTLVAATALLLVTVQSILAPPDDRAVLPLLILMTTLGGTYMVCEAFRTRFEYDNEMLVATTAFRKARAIPWTEIIDISYSQWRSTYILVTGSGTKLAASEYLSGSDALMKFARRWKSFNQENL